MQKKNTIASIVLLVCCCSSCSVSTRDNAKKYETYSQLNSIVEYFAKCYYRLPESKKEIHDFILYWKASDPQSYCYDNELIKTFSDKKTQTEIYSDSLFIYLPKDKLGCCIYGSPEYWLMNPDKYPAERMDYNEQFGISAFDKNSKYIFGLHLSCLFNSEIYDIARSFQFNGLAKIDIQKDSIWIEARYPEEDNLFEYDSEEFEDKLLIKLKNGIMDVAISKKELSMIILPIGKLAR